MVKKKKKLNIQKTKIMASGPIISWQMGKHENSGTYLIHVFCLKESNMTEKLSLSLSVMILNSL